MQAVASAPYTIEPGRFDSASESIATQAAEFCRRALERIRDIDRIFLHLLDARLRGWAVAENVFVRDGGAWMIDPAPVSPRRFRLDPDWKLRLYDRGIHGAHGLELEPDKWVVHTGSAIPERIIDDGELLACVWPWLLKSWGWRFWTLAAERFGNPLMIGTHPPDSTGEIRQALFEALSALAADHVGVVEQGVSIDIKEPAAAKSSEIWRDLVAYCDQQMTKAILGATDLTEPGDNGSKAAVQTRNEVRVERAVGDAKSLAQAIEHGMFEPLLKFNLHLFGGVMPPIPRLAFTFAEKKPTQIFQYHLQGNIVRRNDVRAQLNLPPLRPEDGGEELLDVRDVPAEAAPTTPVTSPATAPAKPETEQ